SNIKVLATRYTFDGQRIGNPIELISIASKGLAEVSASIDPDGDAVVAYATWETSDFDSDPGTYHVYFNRISKTGVVSTRTEVDSINAPSFNERLFKPPVSMDANGG